MRSKMLTDRRQSRALAWGSFAVVFALTLLFGVAAPGLAQNTTGTIRGTVSGAGGAAVTDAQIVARNVETGTSRGTIPHAEGLYVLAGLVPGTYDLTVRRIGATAQTRRVVVQSARRRFRTSLLRRSRRSSSRSSFRPRPRLRRGRPRSRRTCRRHRSTSCRPPVAISWSWRRSRRASPSPKTGSTARISEQFKRVGSRPTP